MARGYTEVVDFSAYAAQADDQLDLLQGALLIASDARPGLDACAVKSQLDHLAEPLAHQGLAQMPAAAQADALAQQLFVAAQFHGNTSDYYDPRNSFLDEVLARRTGIPISLAVLYVEVARRAGVRASPVGFPGHFLACIDDDERRIVVDPFHGGATLDERALEGLLRRSGSLEDYSSDLITPAPVRQVVARMLMNLRGIYATRGEYARLLIVFDRLIDLLPEWTEALRDRGFLFGHLGAPDAARDDLERYLVLSPHAEDGSEVRRWMARFQEASRRGTPSS